MKFLLLNGHGINFRVDGARLRIKNGSLTTTEEPEEYVFKPKRIPYNDIIIYGQSGNVSLEAIKWLMTHNIGIAIIKWDGKLITYIQPKNSVHVKTKFEQYKAYSNKKKRLTIAKKLLEGKFARSEEILIWLQERYPEIDANLSIELQRFKKAKTVLDLLNVEGRIAKIYWTGIRKVIPDKYEFESRQYVNRPMGSVDTINTLLNYGYALLESQCLKAIHSTGLDPYVGYLHEMASGKQPLVYDLQEPFRFLIDLAIIDCLENKTFTKKDFLRTENYNLRLRPKGAQKLTEAVNKQLSQKVKYQGKMQAWHYILQCKTQNLAHYILGKKDVLDFATPIQHLLRIDTSDIREQIKNIKYTEWKKMGYSKGTLHPMKQKIKEGKPFTITPTVKKKLEKLQQEIA